MNRVLLKLSGEQFEGSRDHGIGPEFVTKLAKELKDVKDQTGTEITVVVGGGNFMRGASIAAHGVERVTGDYMGMLATVLNGMALVDILEQQNQPARLQTRVRTDTVAEPYIRRKAIRHLEKGRLVVVAGGTGNPYVTTDTAAVTTALELNCDAVLKATKVDGVYDKDPAKHKDASKYEQLSYQDVMTNTDIAVMDHAAISLARENGLPIVVFDLLTHGNIKRVVSGESIGTKIGSGHG